MEFKKQVEFLTKKGGQGHSELGDNFTVSQSQKTAGQLQALENAVDIKVRCEKIKIFNLKIYYTVMFWSTPPHLLTWTSHIKSL